MSLLVNGADDDDILDELTSLSDAMATMRLERERVTNDNLRSRVAQAQALVAILHSTTEAGANMVKELARAGSQLNSERSLSTDSPPALRAELKCPPLGKRSRSESHAETRWWRNAVLQEASGSDPRGPHSASRLSSVSSLDDDHAIAAADPADLDSSNADAGVHAALRHELKLQEHLRSRLAAHEDERDALRARLAYNDTLIRQLEQVNASLLAELNHARDTSAQRADLLAKRARQHDDAAGPSGSPPDQLRVC